ncbi:MAG: hypothetical protein IJT30_10140 [Muribaculaceae bacterium]|nr:hypothetical protein [Muribaculaceae bacterium]
MSEIDWIGTEQLIANLKNDPDNEQQYCHYICSCLSSTYWFEYCSEIGLFGVSTDWYHYDWLTETEMLEAFNGHWWHRSA